MFRGFDIDMTVCREKKWWLWNGEEQTTEIVSWRM